MREAERGSALPDYHEVRSASEWWGRQRAAERTHRNAPQRQNQFRASASLRFRFLAAIGPRPAREISIRVSSTTPVARNLSPTKHPRSLLFAPHRCTIVEIAGMKTSVCQPGLHVAADGFRIV